MKPESLKCPECRGEMTSRMNKNKNQRFWGCKQFPLCKGTRDTDGLSNEDKRRAREDNEKQGWDNEYDPGKGY